MTVIYFDIEEEKMEQVAQKTDSQESRDIMIDARKALSAVARLEEKWGVHMIADVLRGSEAQRVLNVGHNELSVYGILEGLTKMRIVAMLEAMIDGGLIRRGAHKTLVLTGSGVAVMLGKAGLSPTMRRAIDKAQKVRDTRSITERYNVDSPKIQKTLRLLRSGKDPKTIAEKHGVTEDTVATHAMVLAASGIGFDLAGHLDQELIEELREKARGWKPGDPLTPVREGLDEEECDWARLKLHLVYLFQESQ